MKSFTARTILSSVTLGVILLGAIPSAFAAGNGPSKKIVFGDLDLARREDAFVLYQRVKSAAVKVCNRQMNEASAWDGSAISHRNRCVNLIIDDAVARVNQPTLTAIHNEREVELANR